MVQYLPPNIVTSKMDRLISKLYCKLAVHYFDVSEMERKNRKYRNHTMEWKLFL